MNCLLNKKYIKSSYKEVVINTNIIHVTIDKDLQDIVPGYIENRIKSFPKLRDSLEKRDFKALEVYGHQLKGNAGGYGLYQVGLIGAEIEKSALDKNISNLENSIKNLEIFFNNLQIEYQEMSA